MATYKSKTAETRTGAMADWGWSTGASGYDDEDRLVSWIRDDNTLSQSWTLTKEGDWSQFVENTTTENRTHGPAHELTAIGSTALSYDPKGNLTVDNTKNHKYTWDFDNRMSAADTDGDNVDEVTLKYDALGRRVAKTSGSATVVYVSMTQPIQYSPFAGQVAAEYANGAAPTSPTEKYVYASYIDEPVLKDGTGGTVYYHRNSQYSVAALTNSSGAVVERYAYEPYGELTILAADGSTVRASSSYANTCTYTGRRWDADLSLYYFRARYYDPKLGRFVGRPLAGGSYGNRGQWADTRFYSFRPATRRLPATMLVSTSPGQGEQINWQQKISCKTFLERIRAHGKRTGNPTIDKAIECGAYIFCSPKCLFGGLTFDGPLQLKPRANRRRCYICLDSSRQRNMHWWYALLIHESRHCLQMIVDKQINCCKGQDVIGGQPVPPPGPLPANDYNCLACAARESAACLEQAKYLFPNDALKQQEFSRWCICSSCQFACGKTKIPGTNKPVLDCKDALKKGMPPPDYGRLPIPWADKQ